ncbi:MAG: HAD family phosphatase, partial [Cutibacterium avidum]|nr:HAD family phosphatase [Cutibacterium avidum]
MHTSTANRFAAVLWDFDGTLVDTEPRWVEAELAILSSHGIMWEPEKASSFTGGPMTDVCEAMAGEIGESVTAEDVRHQLITMVSTFNREREVPWRPGVLDLLTEIREAGVPMALVTGSAHAVVEPVLEAVHDRIGNPFDTVVTFDDVTPGTAKPAPDPYLLAAERLG